MKTEETRITFGIDIDEVLRALIPGMLRIYNEEFDDVLCMEDVRDFVVDNSFPKIKDATGESASKWFFQDHGHELFYCSDEINGAREALRTLREYGKVIIISYQKSVANKIDTLQWLEAHGMEYDGICFVKDKSVVHTDWLVDDNDWNFIGSNATYGALINAPYNEETNIEELKGKSNCLDIKRYNSLSEFTEMIKNTLCTQEKTKSTN
jgi:5'(3')-deoxyribonucleotidase